LQADVLFYALGAIGLGLTGLAFGDFARQWQPVPGWLPMRTPLAYLSAALLLGAGIAALTPRWQLAGLSTLGIFFAAWTMLLKTPAIIAAPAILGAWLGFAEISSLALAGLLAASSISGFGGARALRGMRIGYGLCAIIFGLSHYVYADITASMVPEWLPERHFWAYLTGTGHLAAGLALVSGMMARLAARMFGLMMGSFVLLVHLPDTFAYPGQHAAWTIQFVALTLAGGAWLVGGVLAGHSEKMPQSRLWLAIGEAVLPRRYGS
jgi:uncharacterized membrane protein